MIQTMETNAMYEEFVAERKSNGRWELAGFVVGYGSYLICFWIVFGLKRENPLFSSLFFLGLFTRFASLMIGRVFLVPKVFLRLLSPDEKESDSAWQTVDTHRDEILGRLARNIYGWNDPSELYRMDRKELCDFLKEKTVLNWRKIARIFLFFYFPACAIVLYLTYLAWTE
ncbi:hypothetical protein [Leptospira fletcheri]|nr:hypothetical protein [Leptospira fletcheri]